MTTADQPTDDPQGYRAMNMLVALAPRIRGREPYWRPATPPMWREVHLPTWSWTRPDACTELPTVTLDVNAAFLAAASSAVFAHGALGHYWTGDYRVPGYYQITVHPWGVRDIVSPLGAQPAAGEKVWVAHPTLGLLEQLMTAGYWPDTTVHDAWTATETMRLRNWTTAVKADRAAALDARAAALPGTPEHDAAQARYDEIKDGYSIAVQLLRGPAEGGKTKSKVRRPDWYATVHAQHAASTWRKAWSSVLAGHGPVAMGTVDEITWTVEDLAAIQMRSKPLFRLDDTAHDLGALKVKGPEEES